MHSAGDGIEANKANGTVHMADDQGVQDPADPAKPVALQATKSNKGWTGSQRFGEYSEGLYESPDCIKCRKGLRTHPEVAQIVEDLWHSCFLYRYRLHLDGYMDFHLSCFHYITAKDEEVPQEEATYYVDLFEAWDAAVVDWLDDTEGAFQTLGVRSLHFDLFRDSIFELIDMYTTTLEQKQYIKYTKVLAKGLTSKKKAKSAKMRYTWRHQPKKCPDALKTREALRRQLGLNNTDREASKAKIGEMYGRWLESQAKEAQASGEWCPWVQNGTALPSVEEGNVEGNCAQSASSRAASDGSVKRKERDVELSLCGFFAACKPLLVQLEIVSSTPADPEAELGEGAHPGLTSLETQAVVNVFRDLDVDGSGLISALDLETALLDDGCTKWHIKNFGKVKSFKKQVSVVNKEAKAVAALDAASPRGASKG